MAIIYKCINNNTGKVYIGQTIRSLNERKAEHIKELRKGIKRGIWQDEYNKDGLFAFSFEIVEEVVNELLLPEIETKYILLFNALEPTGYNRKLGSYSNLNDSIRLEKYSLDSIIDSLKLLIQSNPLLTIPEISKATGVSVDSVQDISRGKAYRWLNELCPEDYSIVENILASGLQRDSYFQREKIEQCLLMLLDGYKHKDISIKLGLSIHQVNDIASGKTHKWLSTSLPVEYQELIQGLNNKRSSKYIIKDVSTGELITVTNKSEFARNRLIDHRRVSDLLNGRVNKIYGRYVLHKVE